MRRLVLTLTALTLFALSWLGCEDRADDPMMMHIIGNTLVSPRTQCMIRAGATEYRLIGFMDVAVTNTYYFYPQVENALEMSTDYTGFAPEDLRLNSNNITIRGATIYYDFNPDDLALGGVDWAFYDGIFMHASGAARPGEIAPVAVPIIPWELGNEIARQPLMKELGGVGSQINVRIVLEGQLADGTLVQSNEFWYPLNICNGCLVYFPPDVDPRQLQENITVPCAPGQDDGVDTRLCYAYASAEPGQAESLNEARDRCRWLHILQGIEPPDSQFYWENYKDFFPPGTEGPCGLNGMLCQ